MRRAADAVRTSIEASLAALNRRDLDAALEAFAEDFELTEPSRETPIRGRNQLREELDGFLRMITDLRFELLNCVVEGDQAAIEWKYTGTYRGRPVEVRECCVQRFDENDRAREARLYFDRLRLHEQLGIDPSAALAYNYDAFDFGAAEGQLERWLATGPGVGELAPDFQLSDVDGHELRLRQLRGRPVVLEFGSFTCPIFSDRVPAMESLARQHTEAVFLVVYGREAHPGELHGAHGSDAEKRSAALRLVGAETIQRRLLVDHLDGAVDRAYGSAWNHVYVIGPDGRVAMRRAWNDPALVSEVLDALRHGGHAAVSESVEMCRAPGRRPMGSRLLERGGRRSLLDFFNGAGDPVREALRSSADSDVRAVIAEHEASQAKGAPVPLPRSARGDQQ